MKRHHSSVEAFLYFIFPLLLLSCKGAHHSGNDAEGAASGALIETGELAAVTSKTFVMQRLGQRWYDAKISWMAEHGQAIHAGDTIIKLDPIEITRYITDRETQLETQQATLEKMIVNQSNARSQNESAIRSEEATYALSKLSMESVRFESERQQRIRQLQFRQATINLQRARRNRELNTIINENDLKIQRIRVNLIEKDIQHTYELLPQLSFVSPIDGIFQIERKRRWQPELLNIGDEVDAGQAIARVPDLTWMKVNTSIHENDFLKVRVGQSVTVRLDALPGIEFPGEIASVGRLCHTKDGTYRNGNIKVFDVEVRLLVSDERLKPGMTVSCEFHPDNNL
ncbi:MAG: efflux RND transporter periplasmic adaptor subunit [Bacteroidaceae bacterium]|nr:efflux RND transporter periplasmic adaptor subunit [Bacteroidaceae bacterium]MBR4779489.1 efflux RND transporter periplasmic adaptor subunit [Bacteroidaceae bacterium]